MSDNSQLSVTPAFWDPTPTIDFSGHPDTYAMHTHTNKNNKNKYLIET